MQTATIRDELHSRILAYKNGTPRYIAESEIEVRRLLRDADRLQTVDVVAGSVAKADIYVVVGDLDQVNHWLANASKNGGNGICLLSNFCALWTLGHFGKAHDLYASAIRAPDGQLEEAAWAGVKCAAFSAVIEGFDPKDDLNVHLSESDKSAMTAAVDAIQLLERLGVTEADVLAMLDIAGEVLREERVFDLGTGHGFSMIDSDEDAGLLYELSLDCDAQTASRLTDRVIERMVDRNLDKAGLSFSFLAVPSN